MGYSGLGIQSESLFLTWFLLKASYPVFTVKVIKLFHELHRGSQNSQRKAGRGKMFVAGGGVDPSSVLAEITQKSHYAQRIQTDIEKYDQEIKDLIKKIESLKISSMIKLLDFVESTDIILDQLSDETAVLKRFNWPQKYYAFREASALYKELVVLKQKFMEWKRLPTRPIQDELKEMEKFTVSCKPQ